MALQSTRSLSLVFSVPRRRQTELRVEVKPNDDPERTGCHLLFPDHPPTTFVGFPTCNARLHARKDLGYAATYGWVQMVRDGPTAAAALTWEMDPVPITADLNTPFVWFGPEAQLFDAPSRAQRTNLDWTCWSFLTYIEDSLMSKAVKPILAFEWGFRVEDQQVTIKLLKLLDVHEAWEQQRLLLEGKFAGWHFDSFDDSVRVEQME